MYGHPLGITVGDVILLLLVVVEFALIDEVIVGAGVDEAVEGSVQSVQVHDPVPESFQPPVHDPVQAGADVLTESTVRMLAVEFSVTVVVLTGSSSVANVVVAT